MRLIRLVSVILIGIAIPTVAASSAELLAPVSGTVISLDMAGTPSTYYRLTAEKPLVFTVAGPGTASAIVRLALPEAFEADSARYHVAVLEGTDTVRSVHTSTAPTDAEWVGMREGVTLLRKFSFTVPDGQHSYTVVLDSSDAPVAGLRLLLRRASPHAGDSPLYPVAMDRMLTLIYNEKRLDFHLATSQQPVKLRVIGPTRLRMVTRLVYGSTMKGTQKYALALTLDKDQLKPEEFSTTKAINSQFEEESDWVPGKSRTAYIVIPKGEHELTATPQATDAPGVALRFTLPSEDVSNEDKE